MLISNKIIRQASGAPAARPGLSVGIRNSEHDVRCIFFPQVLEKLDLSLLLGAKVNPVFDRSGATFG